MSSPAQEAAAAQPERVTGLAVVADAHVDGPGGDGRELFAQMRRLPDAGCSDLLLLGDLFHVWVGSHKYETRAIADFLDIAGNLRGRGMRLHYVEGNRDFFLADTRYGEVFDRYGMELSFEVQVGASATTRILAVHGDLANPDDRAYRFWAAVSKSPPARFLMRHLPRSLARRAVAGAERGIARTNQKHRHRIPEDAVVAYGRSLLARGHDMVVMGHFHQSATWNLPAGEVRLIDAWFNTRQVEWLP